jgi:hypothetical protein
MEHAQTFALIQTLVDKEKATEAFESYKKIRFPWIESSNNKQKMDHIAKLMGEVKGGALSVTPMAQHNRKVNSRLRRVADTKPAATPTSPAVLKEQKKIYEKMGQAIPR